MTPNREIRHLAMFLRISQEKKNENVETLTNHRDILTDFAEKNNYTYEEFGEVLSGGKTDIEDRVELKRLLDNIERFDGILVVELSRISRNGLISQTVKQYCIDYDKPILTPYQTYDLANNENDRLMYDVGSMISSHEHGVIGKRSKINKIQMIKAGLHVSGNVPFGYIRNKETKKLEIDESAAAAIRYIFKLHSKGLGSFKIRDILNEEGYKSATGKHFNLPSIKRIIRNPHYKGWTVFNDRKKVKKNGKFTYKIIDTITVKDTHPAIIPPEEWDTANRDIEDRATHAVTVREKPAIKSEITILKDLIYCGCCQRKMTIRKDNKSSTGYTVKKCEYLNDNGEKCANSGVRVVHLEKVVLDKILEYKEELAQYVEELLTSGSSQIKKEREVNLIQLKKRLKAIVDQEKKLIDVALLGVFSNDELREKKQELIDSKKIVENQINELSIPENEPSVDDKVEKIKGVMRNIDLLPTLNAEKSNEMLKTFIKKVIYKRVIPEDILKLSTRNKKRSMYEFDYDVKFYKV